MRHHNGPFGAALVLNRHRGSSRRTHHLKSKKGLGLYQYHFEPRNEAGWALVLTDVERPDRNPDLILSDCKKPDDAKHDLIVQAVDGRLRGHVAVHLRDFERRRNIARRQGDEAPLFARMA